MYSEMMSAALALNDQSLRGQRTSSTQTPTTANAETATHTQVPSWSPDTAREPKNDVVMAVSCRLWTVRAPRGRSGLRGPRSCPETPGRT